MFFLFFLVWVSDALPGESPVDEPGLQQLRHEDATDDTGIPGDTGESDDTDDVRAQENEGNDPVDDGRFGSQVNS